MLIHIFKERDIDKNKLQELLEENAQLQLATKTMTTSLEDDKYSSENEECNSGDNSLSEQLTNNAQVCLYVTNTIAF